MLGGVNKCNNPVHVELMLDKAPVVQVLIQLHTRLQKLLLRETHFDV